MFLSAVCGRVVNKHPLNLSLGVRRDGGYRRLAHLRFAHLSPSPPLRLSTPYSRPRVIRSLLSLLSLLSHLVPLSFPFTRVHDLFLYPCYFMKRECTRYTASWLRSAFPYPCNVIVSTPKRGKERSQVDTRVHIRVR